MARVRIAFEEVKPSGAVHSLVVPFKGVEEADRVLPIQMGELWVRITLLVEVPIVTEVIAEAGIQPGRLIVKV